MLGNSSLEIKNIIDYVGMLVGTSMIKNHNVMTKQLERITNPKNIVTFTSSGFRVNLNNMITNNPYIITFEDAKYVAHKNNSDELVIAEIP